MERNGTKYYVTVTFAQRFLHNTTALRHGRHFFYEHYILEQLRHKKMSTSFWEGDKLTIPELHVYLQAASNTF